MPLISIPYAWLPCPHPTPMRLANPEERKQSLSHGDAAIH